MERKYKLDPLIKFEEDLKFPIFPAGIDIIIIEYSIDDPTAEFINALVDNNARIALWLQRTFKFHKKLTKREIQRYFEQCICLAKPSIANLYTKIFRGRFGKNNDINYRPYECFITTLRNNHPNSIEFIEYFNKIYKDDKKEILIREIIEQGCVCALKYAIEKIGWEFSDGYLDDCKITNLGMVNYLYGLVGEESLRRDLLLDSLDLFKKYIRETNDVKKVKKYCRMYRHIIREAIKFVGDDTSIIPIFEFICESWMSKKLRTSIGLGFERYKWIDVEVIIYLIKKFPPTSKQIKKEIDDVINYLRIVKNTELLNCIEKIVGCNLLFL